MDFDKCIRHVANTTIKIHITSITPEKSSCPFAVSFFPSPLALRNHWSAFSSRSMGFSRIWPASDMVFWAAVFHFQLPDTHIPSLDLASLMRPISPAMQPRSRKVCGMGWHQGDEGQEASPGRGRAFVRTWSNKDKSVFSHSDLLKNQNICPITLTMASSSQPRQSSWFCPGENYWHLWDTYHFIMLSDFILLITLLKGRGSKT